MTKSLSLDGRKDKIICSQIDIGNALTPLTKKFTKGVIQANGKKIIEPTMNSEYVAKLVLLIASLPLDTNLLNTTIMANSMPFIGKRLKFYFIFYESLIINNKDIFRMRGKFE